MDDEKRRAELARHSRLSQALLEFHNGLDSGLPDGDPFRIRRRKDQAVAPPLTDQAYTVGANIFLFAFLIWGDLILDLQFENGRKVRYKGSGGGFIPSVGDAYGMGTFNYSSDELVTTYKTCDFQLSCAPGIIQVHLWWGALVLGNIVGAGVSGIGIMAGTGTFRDVTQEGFSDPTRLSDRYER